MGKTTDRMTVNGVQYEIIDANGRANSLSFRRQLTSSDDIHALEEPGMYYIGASSIPDNFPPYTPDVESRLLVIKSTTANNHAAETHYLMAGGGTLWIERYVSAGAGWSGWKKIENADNVIAFQGALTSTDDLHALPHPGMYYIDGTTENKPDNFPLNTPSYETRLLVIKSTVENNHAAEIHLLTGKDSIWFERYVSQADGWSGWMQLANMDDVRAAAIGMNAKAKNEGVLNAIKRARQLTDLKWTPAANIKRGLYETADSYKLSVGGAYLGEFVGGTEYQGVPYTEINFVGTTYPIDAFATSVRNANSAEIVNSQAVVQNPSRASYYGTVCVSLVGYALNLPIVASAKYDSIRYMTNLGYLNHNGSFFNLNSLELCDVLYDPGHVVIITDIIKKGSTVTHVEVSESTKLGCSRRDVTNGPEGGKCRRRMMTQSDFYKYFEDFSVLRFQHLDKIKYVANKYSPMPDEGTPFAYTDLPCMPLEGEMVGYPITGSRTVTVLINSTEYTHLRVLKNGMQFGEYEIGDATSIDIQCDNEEAEYSAGLIRYTGTTVSGRSIYCHWAIKPSLVPQLSIADNELTCTLRNFAPNRFRPWYLTLSKTASMTQDEQAGVYIIFEDDVTKTTNQDGTVNYEFKIPYTDSSYKYVRVGCQSDKYGAAYDTYYIQKAYDAMNEYLIDR